MIKFEYLNFTFCLYFSLFRVHYIFYNEFYNIVYLLKINKFPIVYNIANLYNIFFSKYVEFCRFADF